MYTGQFLKGKKNGSGVAVFTDGQVYTGSYVDDKWDGEGTLTAGRNELYYPEGHILYKGQYSKGK